jgi:hypothetical protein
MLVNLSKYADFKSFSGTFVIKTDKFVDTVYFFLKHFTKSLYIF